MKLSMRAYARRRGISEAAVRKAVKLGRISREDDGTIMPDKADAQWHANTARPKHATASESHTAFKSLPHSDLPTSGTTYLQFKTANEALKYQTGKVNLQSLKGTLIERDKAVAHMFCFARQVRDHWLNWPARVSGQMAQEWNINSHTVQTVLDAHVRECLAELGDPDFN